MRANICSGLSRVALHLTIAISSSNVDGQHSQHVVRWVSEGRICSNLTSPWACIDPRHYIFSNYTLSQHREQDGIKQVSLLRTVIKNVTVQPWKQNIATCRIKEQILKVFSIKPALLLPCVSLPWASAVITTGNYLVLGYCVRHFADAKGHMAAASSVWPRSMQYCSISLVSLYLHYRFESPRGAGEI